MYYKDVKKLTAVALLSLGLAPKSIFSAPASVGQPPAEVVLSPFEVTAATEDQGYAATNSIGATRTKTPLLELPQNIQVFNEQFITDVAATNTWEVVRYASNAVGGDRREDTAATGTSARGYNLTRLVDGLSMPWAPERVDTSMFDRIELVKGSSSVLFGSSTPGGVLNYITKKPSLVWSTSYSVRAGSFDYYKGVVDSTGPLLKKKQLTLAYRLIGSWEHSKSVRDFEKIDAKDGSGTVEARIFGATTVRLRLERQTVDRVESSAVPYLWSPTPIVNNPPGGVAITAPGVLLNLPDSFNRGLPTDYFNTRSRRYDITVEQRISSNWTARAVAAVTDWRRVYAETGGYTQTNLFGTYIRTLQVRPPGGNGAHVAVYDFSLLGNVHLGPTEHLLLSGYAYQLSSSHDQSLTYTLANNFNVFLPQYDGTLSTKAPSRSDSANRYVNQAYFVQDQIKLMNGRLQVAAGIRRDAYNPKSLNRVTNVTTNLVQSKVSPRYSALFRATEGVSIYYAHNETFQPATATRGDGTLLSPPTAKSNEVGVKINILEKKLSGSFAAFRADLGNQARPDPVNPAVSLNTSFRNQGLEADLIYTPTRSWQIVPSMGYLETEITRNDSLPTQVGNKLGSMPKITAALWSKYDMEFGLRRIFSIGLGFQGAYDRFGADDDSFRLPDYGIVNGLLRYTWSRFSITLNAENILDRTYVGQSNKPSFAIMGEPRRFFSTLNLRF